MKNFLATAALVLPMVAGGYAFADEPVRLTAGQMDSVSAGGSALADAIADAIGGGFAFAEVATFASVERVGVERSELTTISNLLSTSASAAIAQAN